MDTSPVLLTVSGTIPPGIEDGVAAGTRPRVDYIELAAKFPADILDHAAVRAEGGRVQRLLARAGGDALLLAIACWRRRRRYRAVFTDSELVGMLYAAMTLPSRRRPRHVMIGHRLSPRKKVLMHRVLRLHRRIDHVVVYASRQREVAIHRLGYRPDQVTVVPFMVDTHFWRPDGVPAPPRQWPLISSAGQELRDYPTLVESVRGLEVDVVLAAASPWSKRADASAGLDLPSNVTVTKLDQFGLRQLYAESAAVVVPIEETDFQAGITTILEAMSMGKPVICSRTAGQTDTVVDGETGVYVPPGDVAALRAAIERVTRDHATAATLGATAQQWVRSNADIHVYATRLAALVAGSPVGRR